MDYSEKILDGRFVANTVYGELIKKITSKNLSPALSIIQIGDNSASNIYVRNKLIKSSKIGIKANLFKFEESVSYEQIIDKISELNSLKTGIILQLPLPKHLNSFEIINHIDPKLDVDGLTSVNQISIFNNTDGLKPCTPLGIINILDHFKVRIEGKHAVVVGRSNLVGKPLSMMLLNRNATVTVCHSKTENLSDITSSADILISAAGIPHLIKENFVKEGATVIDVGINRKNGKICGDVDFENVIRKVGKITPVPGGVGPMTIAMLMKNTVRIFDKD